MLAVLSDNGSVDYDEIDGYVVCNVSPEYKVAMMYTQAITELSELDSVFKEVLCYELAEEIAAALSWNVEGISMLEQKKEKLIQNAYRTGIIREETRIPLKQELYNRAIGIARGVRSLKTTADVAVQQGVDNLGILNDRTNAEIQVCKRCSESVRDKLLEVYPWTFARKSVDLTATGTISGWNNGYSLPDDCLKVIAVIGKDRRADWGGDLTYRNVSDYSDNVELTDYETAGRELYANRDVVYVRYTARIMDSAKWAALFTEALVILMAIEVALNVVGDKNIIVILEQRLARLIEDCQF